MGEHALELMRKNAPQRQIIREIRLGEPSHADVSKPVEGAPPTMSQM